METAFNQRETVKKLKRGGLATNADIRELKAEIRNLRLTVLVVGALIAFAPDIRSAVAVAIGGA